MAEYVMLLAPSANRVYADAAVPLTLAELAVFNQAVLGQRLTDLAQLTLAGVAYLRFGAADLTDRDLAYLANASSLYALFERQGGLLRPIELTRLDRFDDDLITIQKYPGKTNEQFTKLLLNVTLLASASAPAMLDRRLRVLDPLCGRGTTLNQVLTYGYDAAGVDLDGKDFDAYAGFVQTYLKRKKIKHQVQLGPVRRERKVVGKRLTVSLAATKDDYQAGERLSLDVVHTDTVRALEFFRPESFDALVTDAPYGVQHGSRTVARGLRRGPMDLLGEAAPVWARLLRPGGAMGIAWNTHVASRDVAAAVLTQAGLEVLAGGPYEQFRHRVDQAITRDILIARRPA
ncbi:MAG TPA: SAM-dependent methyltransferase [Micromonosporaceae bacterium]